MKTRKRMLRPGKAFPRRLPTRSARFALPILLVALLGLAVHAAITHTFTAVRASAAPGAIAVATPRSTTEAPRGAGMVAAIDPETGRLTTPTAAQMQDLAGGAAALGTGHVEITQLPDGTVIGRLDESFLHYSIAHIDAAGRLHADCSTAAPAATPSPVVDHGTTTPAPEK